MQTPHLPLPPPLPWSPDSQPFIRHMQILSLALLSPGPDESWRIYEALHPDLRSAIPDDIFSSLMARQLGADKSLKRERLADLANLAHVCGMDPAHLGLQSIKDILKAMFALEPADAAWEGHYDTLDWLWAALFELISHDFRRIPLRMKQDWLDVTNYRFRSDLVRTHAALEHLVEHKGGVGITKAASRILLRSRSADAATIAVSLRLAAWCLARGVTVEEETLMRILSRLKARYDADDADGRQRARAAAEGLIAELRDGDAHKAAVPIVLALKHFEEVNRTTLERSTAVAEDPDATIERLYFTVQKLVGDSPGDAELEQALKLCNRALRMDAHLEPILVAALNGVREHPRYTLKFAEMCFQTNVFRDPLSHGFKNKFLNAVLDCLPSETAHDIAVRLYPLARTADEAQRYTWTHATARQWHTLFAATVKQGQLHFASRLYTDMQADGLRVPQRAQISLIKLIASRPSDSRAVLLDRHVKDYLWNETQPVEPLMAAIGQGFGSTGTAEDAAKAVHLLLSLLGPAHATTRISIPARAVEPLMAPLFRSSKADLRALGRQILERLPPAHAGKAYTLALSALVKNIRAAGLQQVLTLYHRMDATGVPATSEIGSLLIMAVLKEGHIGSALAIFRLVTEQVGPIKSAALGRLMVSLALAGRTSEAYAIEQEWRALFPKGVDYDKGVYGARLVVDLKAGRQVDTSVFANFKEGNMLLKKHHGYKPTRSFFNFLESLQPTEAPEKEVTEEVVKKKEKEEEDEEEPRLATVSAREIEPAKSTVRCKRAVPPLTRSWDASGGWLVDRMDRRVDMVSMI
ncbi:hypothetical protein CspHIS471_0607420 [Cutaneotrichosporon sp. HIS471]|nr:hypothetical protein CspHIS471_0607420 [Cutaneotrichosporon sp. HIS471]